MLLKAALWYSASMIEAFMYFPIGNFSIFANSYCLLDTNNFLRPGNLSVDFFFNLEGKYLSKSCYFKYTLENK